jgi:hypothetical protein
MTAVSHVQKSIKTCKKYHDDIIKLMNWYDFTYDICDYETDEIIINDKSYKNIESVIIDDIFYKTKKNLHYYPLNNEDNQVANFKLVPLDIIKNNPILKHLLDNTIFNNYLTTINNYGSFIRFSENKVQRLYWNLPLNAGIPLTTKSKDPVYELVFFLHDLGHLLWPDLVSKGKKLCNKSKMFYTCWRLLGESITVVLNEMLAVDILKNTPEFKDALKLDYDKPYKLFKILKYTDVKQLFKASYQYFCSCDESGFYNLIDKSIDNWPNIWTSFVKRYQTVATRGREWTETNFDNIKLIQYDYHNWWQKIGKHYSDQLKIETIEQYYDTFKYMDDENEIMEYLFDLAWTTLLEPIFNTPIGLTSIEVIPKGVTSMEVIEPISNNNRMLIAFKRWLIGNLFLLVKYDINTDAIINKLNVMNVSDIDMLVNEYQNHVKDLYLNKHIDLNEYLNYKNIFIMIPPNILKKHEY